MSCIRQRPRQMDIRKGVVSLATGAGAVYLLYKAIKAGIKCQPPFCSASPICIARLAIERERHGRDSGELRRLLNSLECKQDAYTKSMILHSITRCVYLLESEASGCTNDDVTLVGSMLDDKDNSVKIQALNTLKAFSGIRKFRLKIQEVQVRSLVGELRSHMPHTSEQGGKKIQLRSRQMEEMEEQNVGEGLPRLLQACYPPSPSVYSPTQGSPNPVM